MIPSGTIALWFSTLISIPDNWILCDGDNGTPDLRNFFVPCAGGSYNPADSAGNVTHLHAVGTSHSHFCPPVPLTVQAGSNYDYETNLADPGINTDVKNNLPLYHALPWIMRR